MLTNNKAMILLADKYGIPDEILDKIYQYINRNKIKSCIGEFCNPNINKVFIRMFNNTYQGWRYEEERRRIHNTINKGRFIIKIIYPKMWGGMTIREIDHDNNVRGSCRTEVLYLNGHKHLSIKGHTGIGLMNCMMVIDDKRQTYIEKIKLNLTDKYCKIKGDEIIPNFKKNMKKEVYYHMLIDIAGVTKFNGATRNIITPRESSRRYIEKHFS